VPQPQPLDRPEDARALESYRVAGLVCMAILILAFPLYRMGEPARRAAARESMREQNIDLGGELFGLHCQSCHGTAGRGGRSGPTLAAKEFLDSVTDEQLRWLIAAGIPGTTMPAYDLDHGGPLTLQEIDQLVVYLRSLEEGAPSVPDWRQGAPAPEPVAPEEASSTPAEPSPGREANPGSEAEDEDEEGPASNPEVDAEELYASNCAHCHGSEGEGSAIAAAIRPPAAPLDQDQEALIQRISEGVPGTAMQAYGPPKGPLEPSEIEALARWLRASDG
jgi:mono/diheme cytochrome c family protein